MAGDLTTYLVLSFLLLACGLYGILVRRNLIALLISLELILNGASISFLAFNRFLFPASNLGEVFIVFIISLGAAEAAVGLGLILAVHKHLKTHDIETMDEVKG